MRRDRLSLTRGKPTRFPKKSYWDRAPMRGARERMGRGLGRLLWVAPRVFLRGLNDLLFGLLQVAWAAVRQAWEDLVEATPAIIRSTLHNTGKSLEEGSTASARALSTTWISIGRFGAIALPVIGRVLGVTAAVLAVLVLAFTPELTAVALVVLAIAAGLFVLTRARNVIGEWVSAASSILKKHRRQLAWLTLVLVGAAEMGFVLFPLLTSSDPFVVEVTRKALAVYALFALAFIALAWAWKRAKPAFTAAAVMLVSLLSAAIFRILQAYARVGRTLIHRLRRVGRRGLPKDAPADATVDATARDDALAPEAGAARLELKNEFSVFKFSFIDMSLVSGSLIGLSWLSIAALAASGFEVKVSMAGQASDGGMATLQISAGWSPESRERMQRSWRYVTDLPDVVQANASQAWADIERIAHEIGESLEAMSEAKPSPVRAPPAAAPVDVVARMLDPQARGASAPLTWRVGSPTLLASSTGAVGIDTLELDGICAFDLVVVLGQASSEGEARRNVALSAERARSAANVLSQQATACTSELKPEVRAIAIGQSLAATANPSQRRLVIVGVNHPDETPTATLRAVLREHSDEVAALLSEHAVFCEVGNSDASNCF